MLPFARSRKNPFARRALATGLAFGLFACTPPALPPTEVEATTASVKLNGRALTFRAPAGRAIGRLSLLIGGKIYTSDAGGKVTVPEAVLAQAEKAGGITVLAPGLAPKRLTPGMLNGPVQLAAATPLATALVAGAGRDLVGGGLVLGLPKAVAPAAGTVTVASYALDVEDGWQARAQATDAGIGLTTCPTCLLTPAGLGLLITVDARLGTGTMPLALDLDAWMRGWDGQDPAPWVAAPAAWTDAERQRAAFAARALAGAGALSAAQRATLASRHGVTFDGPVMTVNLAIGADARTEGATRVAVQGLAGLGVALEVTLVSAVEEHLPAGARQPVNGGTPTAGEPTPGSGGPAVPLIATPGLVATPAPVPTNVLCRDGGILFSANTPLFSENGAGLTSKVRLISDAGSGIITNNSGSILTNNGASVVPGDLVAGFAPNAAGLSGQVRGPNTFASYRLAFAHPVAPLNGITVSLPFVPGTPTTVADANGRFRFASLPATGPNVVIMARMEDPSGPKTYIALAKAPRTDEVTADLDPDSTAISAEGLQRVAIGCDDPVGFNPPGYDEAVARVAALPDYELSAWSRLQAKLYEPPPFAGPATLGAPWTGLLGRTFITKRLAIDPANPNWQRLSVVPAGSEVDFNILGTSGALGAGSYDYRGTPGFVGVMQFPPFVAMAVLVRWDGQAPRLYPEGETLTGVSGPIEVVVNDAPPFYADNVGTLEARIFYDLCR